MPATPELPHAPGLILDRERLSLVWLAVAVVGFIALLYGGFLLFREAFAEYRPILERVRLAPHEVRAYADALSDFALRLFALVFACYLAGGVVLGRFAKGRVLLQSAVGAAVSWLVMFFQIGFSGPVFLPMVVGGAIVTGTAALGAWVGRALRPKRRGAG